MRQSREGWGNHLSIDGRKRSNESLFFPFDAALTERHASHDDAVPFRPEAQAMDVLVVEDDDGVRESLAEFLVDSGFQVEQAESAEDGLMLMEGCGLPGVLVTDLDLGPGIGGLVLAQTIAERWRAIPVIFISGRPWLLQSHPLGPRERFLAKPFRHSSLMQVIKELRASASP